MNIIDTASVVGVMKAASMAFIKSAYFLCFARNPDVTRPSLDRTKIMSGNSNTSPKPIISAERKESASFMLGNAFTYSVVYSPSRNRSPCGSRDEVAEKRAQDKKQGSERNERNNHSFFPLVERRGNEVPGVI